MASRKDNGQGSMYFDEKKGYWYAEIHWSDSSNEKHTKKFSGKTKGAAKKKLDDFKRQLLLSGPDLAKRSVRFKEFADNWLNTKLKISLKPTSFMRKEGTIKYQVYPYVGHIPIEEITSDDVQKMVNTLYDKGMSYSSIKKAYDNVNSCLRQYRIDSKKSGLYNPCEAVVLPEVIKRDEDDIVFYTEDEIKKIYNEATRLTKNGKPVYYHGLAILFLLFTGVRVGEGVALEWIGDIDYDSRTIDINKNVVTVQNDGSGNTKYIMLEQNSGKTYSAKRVLPMSDTVYSR